MLDRRNRIRLTVFTVISLAAAAVIIFRYINLPAMLFDVGRYEVILQLDRAAGLYPQGNVSYHGTVVGEVQSVALTDAGVEAVLSLDSDHPIPAPVHAEVHSQSAIGEQYVDLLPDGDGGTALKNGDVIDSSATSVPPDIDRLLDDANRGLDAIPKDGLKTAINEGYLAVGGLGPELTRIVKGGTDLAIAAEENIDSLITLIDQSGPVLDSQVDTADAIDAWAAQLAAITKQLAGPDDSVAGILENGGDAADQARLLFQRLQPTLPVLLANLVSIGQVAVTYQPAIEQLLVLIPAAVANAQGILVANQNTKQDYKGLFLDFNLNLNLPPVCNTGFLPPQQQRIPSEQDHPPRPPGDLYCRVPQDSRFNVRGARNYPCMTVPGKRAPTVKMCESDENYVPLNDGYNWKGDPNATLSGQDIPQLPPGAPTSRTATASSSPALGTPPPPIAVAEYDPAAGSFIGPDGKHYAQSNLSRTAPTEKSWQSMLMPPQ